MEWTMGKVFIVGILLIYIFTEFVSGNAYCPYICHTNYARTAGSCPEDTEDCLECCQRCIEGNVIDLDNKDVCVELQIVKGSTEETSVVRLDSTIVLPCVFNVKVQCKWELNGQAVDTDRHSRIELAHSSESYATTCSLIISNVNWDDAGNWTCSNAPIAIEHNTNHTLSITTRVQVYQPDQQTQRPNDEHLENKRPDGQRSDDQTQSVSLITSPFLIAGIAVALAVIIVLISIVIYKKLCAKRQSNYRFESSNTESLINRNQEPVKLEFSITINTPFPKEIVAL